VLIADWVKYLVCVTVASIFACCRLPVTGANDSMAGGSDSMMGSGDVTMDSIKEHAQYVYIYDKLEQLVITLTGGYLVWRVFL